FILPEATPGSDPSWFGFPLAVRSGAPFTRNDAIAFLEGRQIATRLLFGGNLVRQPAYKDVPHLRIGDLASVDVVMNHVFWIGVYAGLTESMINYMLESLHEVVRQRTGTRKRALM